MLLIKRHLRAMRLLACDATVYRRTREYFHAPHGVPLLDWLVEHDYGQADVVLCLLRIDALHLVELFVGHPITRCPPCLLGINRAAPRRPQMRIVARAPENPRVEPLARQRFDDHFRVGRTEEQLLARGVLRREISWLKKRGWITVELQT